MLLLRIKYTNIICNNITDDFLNENLFIKIFFGRELKFQCQISLVLLILQRHI